MFLEYGGDNVRFKYRLFTGANATSRPDKLVLDGQQRLTSIYCSIGNTDVVNTTTEKKAPIKRFYYMDVRKSIDTTVDRVEAVLSVPEDRMAIFTFKTVTAEISSHRIDEHSLCIGALEKYLYYIGFKW